jgi:hypothetical protein
MVRCMPYGIPMNTTGGHASKCKDCGRSLRAAYSVRAGRGPVCRLRHLTRVLADFTKDQAEKARELLADGGLVPTSHAGVFRAVSSDGERSYLSHSAACNCPAGLRSRNRCYHSLAVRLVLASGRAA